MNLIAGLKKFIANQKWQCIIILCIINIVYGIKLFNLTLSIDNEAAISTSSTLYHAWESMGRIGLPFIKTILGINIYNPFLAIALMVVLLFLCCLFSGCLFEYVTKSNKKKNTFLVYSLFLVSSPVLVEQLGFVMQSVELLIGFLLIICSLLCFYYYKFNNKIKYLFLALVLLSFSFSIYQALSTVFVTYAVATYILYLKSNSLTIKECWKVGFELVGLFVLSYVIYFLIYHLYFFVFNITATDYTNDQVMWGNVSIKQCILNIIDYIKQSYLARKIFYTYDLLIITIVGIVYSIYELIIVRKQNYLYYFSLVVLFISPFFMGIILGNVPSVRTELSKVVMIAFCWMFYWDEIRKFITKQFIIKIISCILVFFVISQNVIISSRLYYTEYVTNVEQQMIASKITNRIEEISGSYTPVESVVFVGRLQLQRNPSCFSREELELVGNSFFEVSFSTSHGTYLMQNYLRVLGNNYRYPSAEEIVLAEEKAKDMPSWPAKDSIQKENNVIIVKLS